MQNICFERVKVKERERERYTSLSPSLFQRRVFPVSTIVGFTRLKGESGKSDTKFFMTSKI